MNEQQQAQFEELKAKTKLTGAERAQLKALEKLKAKGEQKPKSASQKKADNKFGIKPTTETTTYSLRLTDDDKASLTNLQQRILDDAAESAVMKLGNTREINGTKLLRAGLLLLEEKSSEEIIDAIQQVKLKMIR